MQEVLGYIAVLLALRPEPKPRAGAVLSTVQQGGTESRIAALESQAQAVVLQLDVRMEAPVITMPRSSDSDDKASPPEAPPLHLVKPGFPSQDNRPHMSTISPGVALNIEKSQAEDPAAEKDCRAARLIIIILLSYMQSLSGTPVPHTCGAAQCGLPGARHSVHAAMPTPAVGTCAVR